MKWFNVSYVDREFDGVNIIPDNQVYMYKSICALKESPIPHYHRADYGGRYEAYAVYTGDVRSALDMVDRIKAG